MRSLMPLALALVCLGTSGCLAVRAARMIDSHEATKHFPAKGDLGTAQTRNLSVGGVPRTYLVQAPARTSAPAPIVLLLHGGTQTAGQVWAQTSLPTLGARDRFIVAAPQGVGKHWND